MIARKTTIKNGQYLKEFKPNASSRRKTVFTKKNHLLTPCLKIVLQMKVEREDLEEVECWPITMLPPRPLKQGPKIQFHSDLKSYLEDTHEESLVFVKPRIDILCQMFGEWLHILISIQQNRSRPNSPSILCWQIKPERRERCWRGGFSLLCEDKFFLHCTSPPEGI